MWIKEYDRQPGPTFVEPLGEGRAIDYFSFLLEDRFLEAILIRTNDKAKAKIQDYPEKNKTIWRPI